MRSGSRVKTTRILAIVATSLILVVIIASAIVLFRTLKKHKTLSKTDKASEAVETEREPDTDSAVTTIEPAAEPVEDIPVSEPTTIPDEPLAEEEEPTQKTVTVIGDNVRMRAEPNTDCEVVKTCKKGETYTVTEITGDWTGVDNDGRECYIKSEFVEEVKQETDKPQSDDKAPEAGEVPADGAGTETTDSGRKPEETKKPDEDMVEVECKDGKAMFTRAEYDYFVATWSYTGMADKMMTHHTADELHALYKNTH